MLFGTIAKGHRKCSRRQCRRARRCNYAHLDCAKAFAPPSENEQIEAIASFNRFVHMAQTLQKRQNAAKAPVSVEVEEAGK